MGCRIADGEVMGNKKITEIICKNCGGHDLKRKGSYFVCQNCHSLHQKKEYAKLEYRKCKLFWVSFIIIFLVTLLTIGFVVTPRMTKTESKIEHPKSWYNDVGPGSAYKNEKEKEKSDRIFAEIDKKAKWGLEHLYLTKIWTTEYFNSIKVAKMIFKDGDNQSTYSDGNLFSDLEKEIGKPDEIKKRSTGINTAIFRYHEDSTAIDRWGISIYISYDAKSGMITDKSVMS